MPARVNQNTWKLGYRNVIFNEFDKKWYTDALGDQFEALGVQPASISEAGTDLSYTQSINELASSNGDNVILPLAGPSANEDGLMSSEDKLKLDGIADAAQVNVQSDWNALSGDAFILNKPTLFSGSYDDLTDRPIIPINNSQLTNDSGYLTDISAEELGDLFDVNATGASVGDILTYTGPAGWVVSAAPPADISGSSINALNDVTITSASAGTVLRSNGSQWVDAILDYSDISNTPLLATVATSGSYDDLTNLPTIPTNNNELVNGAGYITDYTVTSSDVTEHQTDITITESQITDLGIYATVASLATVATTGAYADLSGLPTIPSNNNELVNGAEYITDTVDGNFTVNGDVLFTDDSTDSFAGPEVSLYRNSGSPIDGDYLGQIRFDGKNDNDADQLYAKITGKTSSVSNGNENGLIEYAVVKSGVQTIVARQTGDALKLINGTGLEVDNNITVTGTVDGRDVATDGAKLDGIAAGAEVNVQSDWNAVSGDAFIQNKPTLVTTIGELSNVTLSGLTSGDILSFNGSAFVNTSAPPADISGSSIGNLSDVSITSVSSGQVLRHNGSDFVNAQLAYSDLSDTPTLGTAAATDSTAYATAAQGTTADSALQPADIGSTVQAFNANTVVDANYVATDNNFTDSDHTKLDGIAAGAEVNVQSDWNASSGDALILNKPTLFSGSYNDLSDKPTIPVNNNELINGAGYITDITLQPFGDLSNVALSGLASGDIVSYNGSNFVNTPNTAVQPTDSVGVLSDINLSTPPTSGQVLEWNGSAFAPATPSAGTVALDDLIDVSTAGATSGDVLTFNGSSYVLSSATPPSLAYGSKNCTTLTLVQNSYSTVPFTSSVTNSGVTNTTNGIQIVTAGDYQISFSIYGRQTSGSNRMNIRAQIHKDGVKIPGSQCEDYTRNTAQDSVNITASILVSLSAGEEITIVANKDSSVVGQIDEGFLNVIQVG